MNNLLRLGRFPHRVRITRGRIRYPEAAYGSLYNGHAKNDVRNLAPTGFRIAMLEDWVNLLNYLGGIGVAGGKLRDTEIWKDGSENGTNTKGFKAIPSGVRDHLGKFANKLLDNKIWIKKL